MTDAMRESDKDFSKRIHLDWWGQCRTCAFWGGDKREPKYGGVCKQNRSHLHRVETASDGHCPEWESYDTFTAEEIKEEEDRRFRGRPN